MSNPLAAGTTPAAAARPAGVRMGRRRLVLAALAIVVVVGGLALALSLTRPQAPAASPCWSYDPGIFYLDDAGLRHVIRPPSEASTMMPDAQACAPGWVRERTWAPLN